MSEKKKPLKVDRSKLKTIKTYAKSQGITVQAVYKMINEDRIEIDTIDGVAFIVV